MKKEAVKKHINFPLSAPVYILPLVFLVCLHFMVSLRFSRFGILYTVLQDYNAR